MTGKEMAALRASAGLRSKDVATVLAVSPTTVSRWENSDEALKPMIEAAMRYVIIRYGERQKTPAEKLVDNLREALLEPWPMDRTTSDVEEIRAGL